MKLTAWALIAVAMSLAAGCATSSGDFCQITSPIRPSIKDNLTDGTQTQILKLNRYGEKVCKWKP
ncbi:hypothetical protein GOC16_08200 [Sinorhizobium meliloti]|nr:hypothetical protein [Sinorhizobium meliloti]